MDAKKDILFIMNDLHSGGAQKALVSLLQAIDCSRYNIDLLLFRQEGIFLGKIPAAVKILPVPEAYAYFDMPFFAAVLDCLKKARFGTLINRMLAVIVLKTEKNPAVREQKMWSHLSPSLKKVAKKYDAAVGFLEKTPNYFCIEKTTANKKILWIHTNYSNMGMDPKYDTRYFEEAHSIVTVSEDCAADLKNRFPQFSGKIRVVQNIVSPEVIDKLAGETIPGELSFEDSIITVGRMSREKGIDLAIEACSILKEKGIRFKWYFIGDGTQRKDLEARVTEYGLQSEVAFLGEKTNPYPYVKKATVYAQTSRFEGKSIAIDEAKILKKPILATDFSTVSTQITHLENGYIVPMDSQSIANGIIALLSDPSMREKFTASLGSEKLGTGAETEKFYQLIP